jgi:septal ring factor EnvC (AmiA/AmiB activator)
MFMLKSTHHLIVDTIKASAAKLIDDYRSKIEGMRADGHVLEDNLVQANAENASLRRQLTDSYDRHAQTERNACDLASELNRLKDERQVPAVRGSRGRFVKREG